MELLSRTRNDYDAKVSNLLESKGISNYHLYVEKHITHGRAFECWWYEHKSKNHFLLKHLNSPHQLFFIGLEENEVFMLEDFDYFLEHGEFKDDWSLDEMMEIEKKIGSKY